MNNYNRHEGKGKDSEKDSESALSIVIHLALFMGLYVACVKLLLNNL